ncbi:MAG: hypothetical protein HY234_16235 [Acidobacteria bacterium]|nr:hypothetical protein [Acidobacteriota bacterium]MBI3664586.1 hypothetical protein [Acidobacteriota bacterium]
MRGMMRWMLIGALALATPAMAQKQTVKKAPAPTGQPAPQEASMLKAELDQLKQMLLDQARELEATRTALRAQQEKMDAIEKQF